MSQGSERLRFRREALLRRGELQRQDLRDHLQLIGATLDGVDRGLSFVQRVARPPLLAAAGVLLTLLLRRGRTRRALAAGVALLGGLVRLRSTGQMLGQLAQGRSSPAHPVRRSR